jgi:protein phosphatase 2C family protein 2/3
VCRTFGDPDAKLEYRGGHPNVVQAVPEIKTFKISNNHDFVILASDGIYDKLSDQDIGKCVWMTCD